MTLPFDVSEQKAPIGPDTGSSITTTPVAPDPGYRLTQWEQHLERSREIQGAPTPFGRLKAKAAARDPRRRALVRPVLEPPASPLGVNGEEILLDLVHESGVFGAMTAATPTGAVNDVFGSPLPNLLKG